MNKQQAVDNNHKQALIMRLDMLMPMKWMLDFSKQESRDLKDILTQVVQANQEWVEEVVKNLGMTEHRLTDVLHDFRGIYADDEHFLPRIQAEEFNCEMCSKSMEEEEHNFSDICDDCREQDDSEDILGDFDENGDAVDVKEHTFDEVWDNIIEYGIATEDELRLVCHINGNKIESLNDVLEVRTSYKDWSQYKSMEG